MKSAQESPYRFQIEPQGAMQVPGVVFSSREPPIGPAAGRSLAHIADLAALPGIVVAAYAMPGMQGEGEFPAGSVAATDFALGGVVSPDAVGRDISCGTRLLATDLERDVLTFRTTRRLMQELNRTIPRGRRCAGVWRLAGRSQLAEVLTGGCRYAVERGHGTLRDLARCEDRGVLAGADPTAVSARAAERGLRRLGSLGSEEHFLEVQAVEEIYDEAVAEVFGIRRDQVCVMIHSGSGGLGHQISADQVRSMRTAMGRYGIAVPGKRLACVPAESPGGRRYLGAMAAAANYARANRQLLTETARRALSASCGADLELVYDISHNLAKIEAHEVNGETRRLCVHRENAGLALPPGHAGLPPDLAETGQPIIFPGSMGTASYVLTALPNNPAFHSICHGAGPSRAPRHAGQAGRVISWRASDHDIDALVAASEGAGLCRKIARLVPLGLVRA